MRAVVLFVLLDELIHLELLLLVIFEIITTGTVVLVLDLLVVVLELLFEFVIVDLLVVALELLMFVVAFDVKLELVEFKEAFELIFIVKLSRSNRLEFDVMFTLTQCPLEP